MLAAGTLAGWLLIGADSGAYREQLVTKLKNGIEAAEMLRRSSPRHDVALS